MKNYIDGSSTMLGILIGLMLGVIFGVFIIIDETSKWEREIIKRGYAEYTVDVETKEVNFVWKERGIKN